MHEKLKGKKAAALAQRNRECHSLRVCVCLRWFLGGDDGTSTAADDGTSGPAAGEAQGDGTGAEDGTAAEPAAEPEDAYSREDVSAPAAGLASTDKDSVLGKTMADETGLEVDPFGDGTGAEDGTFTALSISSKQAFDLGAGGFDRESGLADDPFGTDPLSTMNKFASFTMKQGVMEAEGVTLSDLDKQQAVVTDKQGDGGSPDGTDGHDDEGGVGSITRRH